MQKPFIKRKASLLTVFGSVLICLVLYWWMTPLRLVVETEAGISLSLPTHQGDTFSLRFTHSVHKTPVWENFVVAGADHVTLVSTEYQSYGVGMPSLPSEGTFTQQGDKFVLTNLNRPFTVIPVRVGPEAKLSLFHLEQEYPLYEWYDSGTLVYIRVSYDYLWLLSKI